LQNGVSMGRNKKSNFLGGKATWAFAIILAILAGSSAGVVAGLVRESPQIAELDKYRPSLSTRIYSSDGVLLADFGIQKRILVSIDEVPDELKLAYLAIEDHLFYEHWGFRPTRIVKKAVDNLQAGRITGGASTITQQLPRNLDLGVSTARTYRRKLRELFVALQIEKKFTKDEILEMYLNQVLLGSAYGVGEGARTYFGKPVNDLTLAECATLAGIPQAPTRYNPKLNPEKSRTRRNIVLGAMLENNYITREQYEEAVSQPIVLGEALERKEKIAPYFVEEVRRQLLATHGYDRLYRGGLTVKTTLDTRMQKAAEEAVSNGYTWYVENRRETTSQRVGDPQDLQIALVALDPETGYVRAMVGGRDFSESEFNRATQAVRQPGSSFKPFVWATALERGYTPSDIIFDAPILFINPPDPVTGERKRWEPENYEKEGFFGEVTLQTALEESLNVSAVKLLRTVGIGRTIGVVRKAGIKQKLDHNLALALGASGVKVIEMASAYGSFANGGVSSEPIMITKVTDPDGLVLEQCQQRHRIVVSEETAYVLTHMMRGVIERGTGKNAQDLGRPAAGKTGTTDKFKDAWFTGYTPDLVCSVWCGFDDNKFLGRDKIAHGMTGGWLACPIWTEFMKGALSEIPERDFEKPDTVGLVRVDQESGLRVPAGYKEQDTIVQAFVKGTEPAGISESRWRRRVPRAGDREVYYLVPI